MLAPPTPGGGGASLDPKRVTGKTRDELAADILAPVPPECTQPPHSGPSVPLGNTLTFSLSVPQVDEALSMLLRAGTGGAINSVVLLRVAAFVHHQALRINTGLNGCAAWTCALNVVFMSLVVYAHNLPPHFLPEGSKPVRFVVPLSVLEGELLAPATAGRDGVLRAIGWACQNLLDHYATPAPTPLALEGAVSKVYRDTYQAGHVRILLRGE